MLRAPSSVRRGLLSILVGVALAALVAVVAGAEWGFVVGFAYLATSVLAALAANASVRRAAEAQLADDPRVLVRLVEAGPLEIQVVKLLREALDVDLQQAESWVAAVPVTLERGVPSRVAQGLRGRLARYEATLEVVEFLER